MRGLWRSLGSSSVLLKLKLSPVNSIPADPTQPLSQEAYEVLAYAGLYPKGMADLHPQARFARYWRRVFGAPQPAYIDISASGEATLGFVPSRDPRERDHGATA